MFRTEFSTGDQRDSKMFRNRTFSRRFYWPPRSHVTLLLGCTALLLLVTCLVTLLSRGRVHPVRPENSSIGHPPSGPEAVAEGNEHSTDEEFRPTVFPTVYEFSLAPGIKRFDNEDARQVGFTIRENLTTTEGDLQADGAAVLFLATRFFGEWNPKHFYFPHDGNATFARYRCPISNCDVTRDPSRLGQARAVLFHIRDTEVFSVPPYRSQDQLWILYSMEPPWLEVRDLRRFDGLFNWTMGYRAGSDVTVRYGFVGRRQSRRKVPRVVPRQKLDRAVWLVSDCNTDSNREGFVRRLRSVYPVDVFGGCGNASASCRPAESRRCYVEVARRYKFYLAFENALCRDYVTEKLFNALEYFIVPVVLGGANYSRLVPRGAVIDARAFPSPEALGRYLWQVSGNSSLYLSHFDWKAWHASYLQPWMCDLCEKLHRSRATNYPAKSGRDLERWWNGERKCLRWTDDVNGFREVARHPFPSYRTRLFADENETHVPKAKIQSGEQYDGAAPSRI